MNYVLYRFVSFKYIFIEHLPYGHRQCFKLRWVGLQRPTDISVWGNLYSFDGSAMRKKQGQYSQVVLSTVWREKGSAAKLQGDEFRLGVSGQLSLEIEYFN